MSNEDKMEIISDIIMSYASDDAKLEAIKLIVNHKGDELELGELPKNIKFMGEDENGNGIYKVS